MRKTIRNGVDRRAVYKFHCTGGCGKVKSTYVYDRAKNGVCATCERNKPNDNQASLFEPTNMEKAIMILSNPYYSEHSKKMKLESIGYTYPLIVNQNQMDSFEKSGIDTSDMVLNKAIEGEL